MQVTFEAGLYYARGADNPVQMEAWGFRWNSVLMAWTTTKVSVAANAKDYCHGEARTRVDKFLGDRTSTIAASRALDADVDVPAPPGLSYRPYQRAGIAYALARRDTLIADSMRLGKTIQAIGVVNARKENKRVLVVSPASVKINWQRELEKWLVHDLSVGLCEGSKNPETDCLVINYDILTRHVEYLREVEWDVLVCDEAHYLKNDKSQRTQAVFGGGGRGAKTPALQARHHRLFLTGTPIYTRPVDLWTLCQQCDPRGLGRSWWNFVHRYCDAKSDGYGLDTSGASNLEELQYKMRETFMIRREKTDVAKEIPPNRQTVVLPKKGLEKLVARETDLVRQNLSIFEQLIAGQLDGEDAFAQLGTVDGVDRSEIEPTYVEVNASLTSARRELALAKLKMCFEHMDALLESENKIVIFAHHRDVVARLKEHYPDAAVLVGGIAPDKRQEAIDRFVTDPNCRVFIGNIIAAGQGINLSVADVACFVELSWVPAELDQAEERVWDVLKERPISIYRYVVEDSADEIMCHALESRQRNIEKALKARSLGA